MTTALIKSYLDSRWEALVNGASTGNCADCKGCCRAGYVIGLSKDEAKYIPHTRVGGVHAVLMPREDGSCPMLIDERCSIYFSRPQACRDFDCRDMAMAGIMLSPSGESPGVDAGIAEINASIQRHMATHNHLCLSTMSDVAKSMTARGFAGNDAAIGGLLTMLRQYLDRPRADALMKEKLGRAETQRTAASKAAERLLHKRKKVA